MYLPRMVANCTEWQIMQDPTVSVSNSFAIFHVKFE